MTCVKRTSLWCAAVFKECFTRQERGATPFYVSKCDWSWLAKPQRQTASLSHFYRRLPQWYTLPFDMGTSIYRFETPSRYALLYG